MRTRSVIAAGGAATLTARHPGDRGRHRPQGAPGAEATVRRTVKLR